MMKYALSIFTVSLLLIACKTASQNDGPANNLINESSPYLLQHAYNPVNWNPWNDAALEKAKSEDKLMIISVGYSSCHWCHVMEHESFEDSTVAALMNEHFVSIKVDREERPDIDNVYMTACQIASEGGCGWPLNAFALPDGRPVWAGTYFPKDNWLEILNYFQNLYQEDRAKLEQFAIDLTKGISSRNEVLLNDADQEFRTEQLTEYSNLIVKSMDMKKGGRQGSQKFPMPGLFDYLMDYGSIMDDDLALAAVDLTLTEIANGGIYDHWDGGFARYTVDPNWHVPHFEKMLYDNSQLVSLYSKGYQLTKNELFKNRIVETLDFIEREWTDRSGGIYSSYDADSENDLGHKEEGVFYIWKKSEVESILKSSNQFDAFCAYYDITEKGNWEKGYSIPRVRKDLSQISKSFKIPENELKDYIAKSILKLSSVRSDRKLPGLDDKILTSWNALMLQGYIDAYRALGDEDYKSKALAIARFMKKNMIQSDYRLLRNHKDGKSVINAFLEDYALLSKSLISLYGITFDEDWLEDAQGLMEYANQHFYKSSNQMYSYTSDEDAALIAETVDYSDKAVPGSNSTMASNLFTLGTYMNDASMIERSKQMLHNVLPSIDQVTNPAFYYNWLNVYLSVIKPPYEVAVIGDDYQSKLKDIQSNYIPNAIFLGGDTEGTLELLKNKLVDGQTMIYVCQNKVCKLPTEDVEKALGLME